MYSTCCKGPASCYCDNFDAACGSTDTRVTSCPGTNVCSAGQTPVATCKGNAVGPTDGGPATDAGSDAASGDSAIGEASASDASEATTADSASDGALALPRPPPLL
jgi:hypothetical protein